jgi:phage-related minor tail protein
MFGGARASGGPVSAGKVFAVGERGPELFIPSVPGVIMPNHATQMGGGMTVQMTVVTPDAASFRRSEGQIGLKLASVASAGRRFA